MKSYFFLFIIALSIAPCYAQSLQYHPFVEEGKVWKMKYHTEFPQYIDYDYCYYLEGDTLIDNVACKKMYAYNINNTNTKEYQLALYEDNDNGIVYFFPKDYVVSYVLYDFNIPLDSTRIIKPILSPEEWDISMKNNADKLFCFNGIQRHSLLVNYEYKYTTRPLGLPAGWWIEGVGSELGPLNPCYFYLAGGSSYLVECEMNHESIFTISDLRKQNPMGDINIDGIVNINDLMQLVNYLVGQTTVGFIPAAADVNHSGKLDLSDVMFLVNCIVK